MQGPVVCVTMRSTRAPGDMTMPDIDEATGLPTKEWNVGTDCKGRVLAV